MYRIRLYYQFKFLIAPKKKSYNNKYFYTDTNQEIFICTFQKKKKKI